ncbi:hypothetical protein QE435_003004 [Rhizobium sp. SORGH_AS 787]|nr:hypothetical protein [Rhizobium sp. SORGH_AS_0787]
MKMGQSHSAAPTQESKASATARGKLVAIGEIGQGEFRPKRVFG